MKIIKFIAVALCAIMTVGVIQAQASGQLQASNFPSLWAQEQVNMAIAKGLVPGHLQSNFTQAATRAEFCALAVRVYEAVKGEIAGRTRFTDTSDSNVEKAAFIGIVNGVGNNRFDPDAQLTREMAAVMLANLANAIGQPLPQKAPTFADNNEASAWALESIGRVQAAGVMSGTGDNMFSPKQPYTREQSIITVMRVFNDMNDISGNLDVLYIRTNGYVDGKNYPIVTVISSRDELERYYENNKNTYDFSANFGGYSDAISFIDAMKNYTDAFFTNRSLVLVLLEEGSGSIRHRVDDVGENGDIVISRLLPEIGTADMAQWHIIIELDANFC